MKHILPILTLTTLTAAAFADASAPVAAASGLSYNNVTVSYSRFSASGFSGHANAWMLSANALIGNSNVIVSGSTFIGGDLGNGGDTASIGYVFKNVGGFADAVVSVGSNETYSVALRKDLGSNFEAQLDYSRVLGEDVFGLAVGYSINKSLTVGLGYARSSHIDFSGAIEGADNVSLSAWTASVRYNF